MRTPETHYFDHGFFKFKKIKGIVMYETYIYSDDGKQVFLCSSGRVFDKDHLELVLQKVTNARQALRISESTIQDLGSVKT